MTDLERARRFEDLLVWQKARVLTREIYDVTRQRPLERDFSLVRQMQRASSAIMSNIAEGFDRHGAAEFHHFVSIAGGSCSEVQSHLYVALDAGYIADQNSTASTTSLQKSAECSPVFERV